MFKWKRKVLLAKSEVTYGTDPTPSGAANAILARNVQLTPLAQNYDERDYTVPYFGNKGKIVAGSYVQLTFDVEIAGAFEKIRHVVMRVGADADRTVAHRPRPRLGVERMVAGTVMGRNLSGVSNPCRQLVVYCGLSVALASARFFFSDEFHGIDDIYFSLRSSQRNESCRTGANYLRGIGDFIYDW